MTRVDLDQIAAIDVHVHAERNENEPQDPVTGEFLDAAARYFGGSPTQPTAAEVALAHFRSPSSRAAFSFSTRGRTSSLIGSRSKSASQRSGVIRGKSEPNSILCLSWELV